MSLRARLALLSGLSLAVCFALVSVVVYVLVARGLEQRLDNQLRAQARQLLGQAQVASTAGLGDSARVAGRERPGRIGGLRQGRASGKLDAAAMPARLARRQLISQLVEQDGSVAMQSDPLRSLGEGLPVDDVTLRLAGTRGERFHGGAVGDDHLRILDIGTGQRRSTVLQLAVSDTDLQAALQQLRRMLALGGLVATLAAALLGWLLAGAALGPIARVVHAARQIATTRDTSQRVPVPPQQDEVGELAATVNDMLVALDEAQQAQQRFVADASHELRTPLTSMQGNIDFLARSDLAPDARREALADLRAAVLHLAELTTALLELARADAGFVEQRSDLDLSALVEETCGTAKAQDAEHPVHVDVQPRVHVLGNRVALGRALGNLLENARRYTPAGTSIEVTLRADGQRGPVRVCVRDHGPGMSSQDAASAFDRFHRAATAGGIDGTGLGLAIVRQTLRAHGGDVRLETAPGAGCAFELSLPAA